MLIVYIGLRCLLLVRGPACCSLCTYRYHLLMSTQLSQQIPSTVDGSELKVKITEYDVATSSGGAAAGPSGQGGKKVSFILDGVDLALVLL